MKKPRKQGSGRKPGDGVLKNIDPASHISEKIRRLTYGRAYDKLDKQMLDAVCRLRLQQRFEHSFDPASLAQLDAICQRLFRWLIKGAAFALHGLDSDWFQKMADVIKATNSDELYPLHIQLLLFSAAGKPPSLTIPELCERLEFLGKRPTALDDNAWQVTVRRACDRIGFPYLSSKPGRKQKHP